jgi:hypothetical protein
VEIKRHWFGIQFVIIRLNQLAKLETGIPGLAVRSSKAGHIMSQAFAGLVYVGIFAAFASIVFIGWLISLVIW